MFILIKLRTVVDLSFCSHLPPFFLVDLVIDLRQSSFADLAPFLFSQATMVFLRVSMPPAASRDVELV